MKKEGRVYRVHVPSVTKYKKKKSDERTGKQRRKASVEGKEKCIMHCTGKRCRSTSFPARVGLAPTKTLKTL